ncbi:MAG: DUF2103 domain-containing protein [Cyanobacteria bacterium P01_F01_bin.4]
MGDSSKGRVVLTHSTHIPGLISVLEKLAALPQVSTLTPAVIRQSRSHSPRFRLKVSVPIRGGYKLIARKGKTVQEVFAITDLPQPQLASAIQDIVRKLKL